MKTGLNQVSFCHNWSQEKIKLTFFFPVTKYLNDDSILKEQNQGLWLLITAPIFYPLNFEALQLFHDTEQTYA